MILGTPIVESKAPVKKGIFTRLRLIRLLVLAYLCCLAMARIGPVNTKKSFQTDFATVKAVVPTVRLASGGLTFVQSVEYEINGSLTLYPKSVKKQDTHGWAPPDRITSLNVFNPAPTSRVITGTVVIRDMACQQSPIVNIAGAIERVSMPMSEGGYQNLNFVTEIEGKQSKYIFLIIDGTCLENQLIEILSLQITW